jgi:glucosylceramidase
LGLTVQNEPMAKQTWESCIYTAEESVILSKLFRSNIKKCWTWRQKITVWDHNRDLLSQRASTILDDPQASKYVWNWFHWYESWSGGDPMFDNVGKVHEMYPDKTCFY